MSGRYFLDTNVLVYSFDSTNPHKRERARALVSAALGGAGLVGSQVVQEFLNVALRKFARPMTIEEARAYLDAVLMPLCQVHTDFELYREGLALRARWGFSFYDSLMVAAALRAGCTTLYSEDLHHGQRIGELTIVDPFRPG